MNIGLSLFFLISAGLSLFLGTVVLIRNYRETSNKIFGLICFAVAFWITTVLMADTSKEIADALLWSRLAIIGPLFLAPLMLWFSFIYPRSRIKIGTSLLFLNFLPTIFLLFFVGSDYNVSKVWFESWGTNFEPGVLYLALLVLFTGYFGGSLYNFFQGFKTTKGIEKEQIKYFFLGVLITVIFGVLANIILPLAGLGISSSFGPLSILFFIGFTFYAITRYRLLDINRLIGKWIVWLLSFSSITAVVLFLSYLNQESHNSIPLTYFLIIVTATSILLFRFFFLVYSKILSQYFQRPYDSILNELSQKLTEVLKIQDLSSLICKTIFSSVSVDRVVVLLQNKNQSYRILHNIGFQEKNGISLVSDNALTKYLEETQSPLVYEELSLIIRDSKQKDSFEVLKNNMKNIEARVCLPLLREKKIIGIIILGNKKNGSAYSREDLDVLMRLANNSAVAFDNARLYKKVDDYSRNLEKKVEKQLKQLKEAYDDLEIAYEKLQQLDKAKTEFISIVSHQLRTPLTIMKGYVSMILEGSYDDTPKRKLEVLQNVYDSNNRLITLVNDVLNISRIQSGRVALEKEKKQIEDVVNNIVDRLSSTAKEKGISLIFNKPKKKLPLLDIDETKIENVFLNLIDNAIKYTPSGSIKITITKAKEGAKIKIQDTGEGMNKEELTKLFETFRRGSAGQKLWTEGSGLGLYIAKQFVEIHGGKVWAESKGKGKGSTFYVVLPYA